MARILYSGTRNASSWALRAWLALREAEIAFEEQVVDIRKPQRHGNLARIGAFSPPAAVPVLVDEGTVVYDSLAIMEYANELSGGRLLPAEIRSRAHVRSLLAWQHSGLSGLCARLSFESAFYPRRRPMTAGEHAQAQRLFAVWEDELTASGGPHLAGALSLADLAFAPTVVRLAAHAPDTARWPLARAWMSSMLARPALREWLEEAARLPPVYLDDYAVEGDAPQ
ncbi:glutathione S-transferase family protein [Luteimonas aquatica]|uniref:glutathione S-transferase family protein n=1 Tax=Luteimonas aquatica TaxID=450364 RepID=UPI001F572CB4|nr:glutathione S-transferase family protein [Luteimonas aquatica]